MEGVSSTGLPYLVFEVLVNCSCFEIVLSFWVLSSEWRLFVWPAFIKVLFCEGWQKPEMIPLKCTEVHVGEKKVK